MGCYISSSTLTNTVNTFPSGPSGKPYFAMPLFGNSLQDVLASFNPDSFLQAAQYVGDKAVCDLTVLGSTLASAVAPQGPLGFISNAVLGAADLMSTLPVQGNVYYFAGMYATGVPGLSDDLPDAIQIAAAFNPCIGEAALRRGARALPCAGTGLRPQPPHHPYRRLFLCIQRPGN
jgi:hypothetical protein